MPDIIHHTGWVIERCPFCKYETEAHEALDLLPDGKVAELDRTPDLSDSSWYLCQVSEAEEESRGEKYHTVLCLGEAGS